MTYTFHVACAAIVLFTLACQDESTGIDVHSDADAQPEADSGFMVDGSVVADRTPEVRTTDMNTNRDVEVDMTPDALDMTVADVLSPDGVAPCMPDIERCDGVDNDCDFRVDEAAPQGSECTQIEGVCTLPGTTACVDGQVVCILETPAAEMDRCRALVQCRDRIESPITWAEAAVERPLMGQFEIGQTHIARVGDPRRTPKLINAREALVLFTPDAPLPAGRQLRLRGRRGNQTFGFIPMNSPENSPPILESALSRSPLQPYSTDAHSAVVPWNWLVNGMRLTVEYTEERDGQLVRHRAEHQLRNLGAPHRFTVTRSKIVLFGEADFPTETMDAHRLARDFFPTLPIAELRVVDSLPWRLDYIVARANDGPVLVRSEQARRERASDTDHWSILKNQFALRLSLANTGRGLSLTREADGDSSPYSLGTSVAMGWYRDPEGMYRDIDDAPWAAGWTGWTAMWAEECGNTFIHEVGHSFTLEHFAEGTAENWGIGDEYPQDGTHLATHPWGYDSLRRQLRTWYRVQNGVPVREGDTLVGKRDPLNGGEPANAVTCFPQYTAYHGQRIQEWLENTPTILRVRDHLGPHVWNVEERKYLPVDPDPNHQRPTEIDVPVVTLIGTLGNSPDVNQTYPPIFTPSGYAFQLPDPLAEDLGEAFLGARHFLEIDFENGRTERALIARGRIDDSNLYLYSLNLPQRSRPVEVRLKLAESAYPELDPEQSVHLHTRSIEPTPREQPDVVRVGRTLAGPAWGQLNERCDENINCHQRSMVSSIRNGQVPVSFSVGDIAPGESVCSDAGSHGEIRVPVVDEDGDAAAVIVHVQRGVQASGCRHQVHLADDAPYCQGADQEQTFRAWIPFQLNDALPPGRYRSTDLPITAFQTQPNGNRRPLFDLSLGIDLTVAEVIPVDLNQPWTSPGVATQNSSIYFLVRDPLVGPTERVWWDDGDSEYVVLNVPVRDRATGVMANLRVRAQQIECGEARIDFHAGRTAHDCPHQAYLWVESEDNLDLEPDALYESVPSAPLIIDAHRWHEPNARALLRTFHLEINYRHPDE